jgi:hypothetical protein
MGRTCNRLCKLELWDDFGSKTIGRDYLGGQSIGWSWILEKEAVRVLTGLNRFRMGSNGGLLQ